mgnify:CR=1 FL=1
MHKKLIEVSLPLEDINKASSREKSIRHGNPSTLHLWWSRKPLATTRAVLWASLVDDPSSHPEKFPTPEAQEKERKRLFGILSNMVIWENTNNPDILKEARAELPDNLPELLDPFAGGGSIPLEGQRLGMKVHAHDLNPVAVLINKAMIEIPPKFAGLPPVNPETRRTIGSDCGWNGASGLADDVKYYGGILRDKAFDAVGNMYPKIDTPEGEAVVIAWIWARTVRCPNPACGCDMPLVNSFVLSSKKGHEVHVIPVIDDEKILRYEVRYGKNAPKSPKTGKGKFMCCACGSVASNEYLHEQFTGGNNGRVMIAIVAEGNNGRLYLSPTDEHVKAADVPLPEDYPDAEMNQDCTDLVSGRGYGFTHWHQLFTNRQLTMLTTFSNLIPDIMTMIEHDARNAGRDNPEEYAKAVGLYLAFVVDKLTDYHSAICSWHITGEKIRNTFGRQAIPMVWDYAEGNPFSNSSGCYSHMLQWIAEVIAELPACSEGEASQSEAQAEGKIRNVMISTDPPYYDNIGYADLSDYFYIWLRRTLKDIYPELFRLMLVPKNQELIAAPYRHKNSQDEARKFFEDGMKKVCANLREYASDDIPVTIYYAYKQKDTEDDKTSSSGWETMLNAIISSGFTITGTWPMRTERVGRTNEIASSALASSIVLVCRRRPSDAPAITRREFAAELRRNIPPALEKLQQSNIAPVDMPQSAIGPGMAIYSKYSRVLESDGQPMTIRTALQIINQELDAYLNGQDISLDSMSRFCVELYEQKGFDTIKFGDADNMARAKSISVASMTSKGIVQEERGEVHLTDREDLKECGSDVIWVLAQKLTYAMNMNKGGYLLCANIAAAAGAEYSERARALAYRLYTIADRKKWTKEAFAYNSLVVAWPNIMEKMNGIDPKAAQINISWGDDKNE